MCCFSKPVRFVGRTRIFARRLDASRQLLVYAMDVELDEPLAMVLPIPVAEGAGEHDVRFVDLSADAGFFDALAMAFPPAFMPASRGASPGAGPPRQQTLVVHEVGMYVASFVPTAADFARLDPRFRLGDGVLSALGVGSDHGFAVFQLAPARRGLFGRKSARQAVHPMAFVFPTRTSEGLFFPTLHVHDGTVPVRATFDHALYCQAEGVLGATLPWASSQGPLDAYVRSPSAERILATGRGGFRETLNGPLPNRDVELLPPRGLTEDMLALRGECFEARLAANHAYTFEPHDDRARAWKATSSTRMPELHRGLAEGLAWLERERRDAFGLFPLGPELPAHFMNGDRLERGTSFLDAGGHIAEGPIRIAFREFTDRVEPQPITLGFARAPDAAALADVRSALRGLLDRSVA